MFTRLSSRRGVLLVTSGAAARRTVRGCRRTDAWLANTETDLGRGSWVGPNQGQESLRQYAGSWMKRTDLADCTRGKYEGLLRSHILPMFGNVELRRQAGAASRFRTWYYELDGRYPGRLHSK